MDILILYSLIACCFVPLVLAGIVTIIITYICIGSEDKYMKELSRELGLTMLQGNSLAFSSMKGNYKGYSINVEPVYRTDGFVTHSKAHKRINIILRLNKEINGDLTVSTKYSFWIKPSAAAKSITGGELDVSQFDEAFDIKSSMSLSVLAQLLIPDVKSKILNLGFSSIYIGGSTISCDTYGFIKKKDKDRFINVLNLIVHMAKLSENIR